MRYRVRLESDARPRTRYSSACRLTVARRREVGTNPRPFEPSRRVPRVGLRRVHHRPGRRRHRWRGSALLLRNRRPLCSAPDTSLVRRAVVAVRVGGYDLSQRFRFESSVSTTLIVPPRAEIHCRTLPSAYPQDGRSCTENTYSDPSDRLDVIRPRRRAAMLAERPSRDFRATVTHTYLVLGGNCSYI